mgnify:CR=1 FL=1
MLAAILMLAPVRGLRPVVAARADTARARLGTVAKVLGGGACGSDARCDFTALHAGLGELAKRLAPKPTPAATLKRIATLRTDAPLFDNASLRTGTYRLTFDVAGYFKARGVALPEPNFLNQVSLDFGIAHADQHYHVPLLVSPWSYSTYRGS